MQFAALFESISLNLCIVHDLYDKVSAKCNIRHHVISLQYDLQNYKSKMICKIFMIILDYSCNLSINYRFAIIAYCNYEKSG